MPQTHFISDIKETATIDKVVNRERLQQTCISLRIALIERHMGYTDGFLIYQRYRHRTGKLSVANSHVSLNYPITILPIGCVCTQWNAPEIAYADGFTMSALKPSNGQMVCSQ